jgi:ribose transport system permease protein
MLVPLKNRFQRNTTIVLVFVLSFLLFAIVSVLIPGFGSFSNIRNLLIQIVILAIIAGGQTFAVLTGGIDLSISWLMTVSAVLTAYWANGQNSNLIWVIPAVLGVGILVGAMNGFGVSYMKVPPIIMTLATGTILNGAIVLVVGFAPPPKAPSIIEFLAHGSLAGIPFPLIILVLMGAIVTIILSYTPYGRRLYAVGTNSIAAKFSGIEPNYVLIITYLFSSTGAVLSGFILLGFTGTADLGIGVPYQFPSLVATIVGGASILGGSGHFIGTIGGTILITILRALLTLFNLGAGAISIFYGLTILFSVWLASLRFHHRKAQQ